MGVADRWRQVCGGIDPETAEGIATLLHDLEDPQDGKRARRVFDTLASALYDQDCLEPACPLAVPFVASLVDRQVPPVQAAMLRFLFDVAVPAGGPLAAVLGEAPAWWETAADGLQSRTTAAVRSCLPAGTAWFESADPGVRACTASLHGWLGHGDGTPIDAVAADAVPWVRAAGLVAAAVHRRVVGHRWEPPKKAPRDAAGRAAHAVGRAMHGGLADASVRAAIGGATVDEKVARTQVPSFRGDLRRAALQVAAARAEEWPELLEAALSRLAEDVPVGAFRDPQAQAVLDLLDAVVLPSPWRAGMYNDRLTDAVVQRARARPLPRDPSTVGPGARRVLRAIAGRPQLLRHGVPSALSWGGIPPVADALAAWLDGAPQPPALLDRAVGGRPLGARLADAVHAGVLPDAEAVAEDLGPDLLAAVVDLHRDAPWGGPSFFLPSDAPVAAAWALAARRDAVSLALLRHAPTDVLHARVVRHVERGPEAVWSARDNVAMSLPHVAGVCALALAERGLPVPEACWIAIAEVAYVETLRSPIRAVLEPAPSDLRRAFLAWLTAHSGKLRRGPLPPLPGPDAPVHATAAVVRDYADLLT